MTQTQIISITYCACVYVRRLLFALNSLIIRSLLSFIIIHYESILFVSFLGQNVIFTDSCYRFVKRFKFSNHLYHLCSTASRRIDRFPGHSCVRHCQCSSNPLYPRSRRRRSASSSRNFATLRDAERRVAPSLDDASRSRESRRRTAAPVCVCMSCETVPFSIAG